MACQEAPCGCMDPNNYQGCDCRNSGDCAREAAFWAEKTAAPVVHQDAKDALERIGWPLRTDSFAVVLAGKPNFASMIVRDDDPGCASILAQQMGDQMAEDFVTVITALRNLAARTQESVAC